LTTLKAKRVMALEEGEVDLEEALEVTLEGVSEVAEEISEEGSEVVTVEGSEVGSVEAVVILEADLEGVEGTSEEGSVEVEDSHVEVLKVLIHTVLLGIREESTELTSTKRESTSLLRKMIDLSFN
jgi:hypothetical protein